MKATKSPPLMERTGRFVQLPINRWCNQPPRLRDAEVASRNLLDRAATPWPRRGISLEFDFVCKAIFQLTPLFLVAFFLVPHAQAQAQSTRNFELEAGANYRHLTNGYPPWVGGYLRLIAKAGGRDTLYFEVLRQREFDDTGTYFSVADSHTINDDWYVFGAIGSSVGGFFFPSVRADAQLNKKWLAKRQLVTTVGAGYFDSKDEHRDASLFLGGIYYFDAPWIVQGGVRWNWSRPGAVVSQSQFLALTHGREGTHFIVFRGAVGREAWQALGPEVSLVNFPSYVLSVNWKQWLSDDWGFNGMTEYYKSSVYQRTGFSFGIFKSF